MAAEDVGGAEGTVAEMEKKTGLFLPCATGCGLGATCWCSEVSKLKQKRVRISHPVPERLFLIYKLH